MLKSQVTKGTLDIYDQSYFIYIGCINGFKKFMLQYIDDVSILDESSDAMTPTVIDPSTGIDVVGVYIEISSDPEVIDSISIPYLLRRISHESTHFAASVLMKRGLRFTQETEEAYAYLIGWITEATILQVEHYLASYNRNLSITQ